MADELIAYWSQLEPGKRVVPVELWVPELYEQAVEEAEAEHWRQVEEQQRANLDSIL